MLSACKSQGLHPVLVTLQACVRGEFFSAKAVSLDGYGEGGNFGLIRTETFQTEGHHQRISI